MFTEPSSAVPAAISGGLTISAPQAPTTFLASQAPKTLLASQARRRAHRRIRSLHRVQGFLLFPSWAIYPPQLGVHLRGCATTPV